MGIKYLSEGSYQEAIIAFTAAIEIDPKRPEAYVGRGDACMGSGTAEDLAAAQADYETALELDNTLEEAWLGLIDLHILQEDYEGAQCLLEQALAVIHSKRLQEKQEELAQLMSPEPGSEGFLRAAEAHLLPSVDFDCVINGVHIVTADIHTVANLVGGRVSNTGGDYYFESDEVSGSQAKSKPYIGLLTLQSTFYSFNRVDKPAIQVWPSEYFAGISAMDTLDQALEKLGFTEAERSWLATCSSIELWRCPDGTCHLDVDQHRPDEGSYQLDKCELILFSTETGQWCSYHFEYSMEEAGFEEGTPVDGRAELRNMSICNHNA